MLTTKEGWSMIWNGQWWERERQEGWNKDDIQGLTKLNARHYFRKKEVGPCYNILTICEGPRHFCFTSMAANVF